GEVGNASIAGHRNTYGRVFEDIARLEAGDPIVVETADAFYVYETTESLIVQPEDVEVIAPTPGRPGVEPTERMLTLTACHPMYSARERIIVHAEFSYWTKRSDGIPEALAQDADAGTEAGVCTPGCSGTCPARSGCGSCSPCSCWRRSSRRCSGGSSPPSRPTCHSTTGWSAPRPARCPPQSAR